MKKFTFLFLVSLSFIFSGCTKDFRSYLAGDPKWVPRNIASLSTAQGVQPILAERVPLVLNIKMDADWNNKNRPAPLDRWETYEVNEKVINFLVKDVRIDGGSGKLFFRYEKDGKELLGAQVEDGTKLKCGDTKLFYVPDTNESCRTHNIHILCKILTVNYEKESGKMHDFSIKLGEPNYNTNISTEAKIAYVQDKEGTPIELRIESDNKLAELQKYKIVKSTITGGKGRIYIEGLDGVKKPICGNEPIQFGTTKLFYKPSLQSGSEEESHKIHLTIGNSRGHVSQESSIEFKVQDHIISDFEAKITIDTEDKLLLPYKEQSCILTITPLEKEEKEMEYKVSSISLGGGKFFIGGQELREGIPLKSGKNKLIFKPLGYMGDAFPTIVVTNEKGDSRYVKFIDQFVISHPQFSAESSISGEHIVLNISCDHKDSSDKFYVTNYTVSGGLKGKLKTLRGKILEKCIPVLEGNNEFVFEVDQTSLSNIHEAPKIYFKVSFPGHSCINTEGLDLSRFVLDLLSPKISELDNKSKELYKPLVQDYTIPLDSVMKQLVDLESTWNNGGSKMHDILVCLEHGTDVSDQAKEALANIQLLQTDTKDKMQKRVLTTSMLSRWNKELSEIDAAQSSEERKIREGLLERQIESFSDVFESCVNIEGLQDIPGALVSLRMDIERVKIETVQKETRETDIKTEYRNFQQATRNSIEAEGKARQNGDDRLSDKIKEEARRLQSDISSLERSRDEIEQKIRNHTGSIEDLEEKVRELDRVNGKLSYKYSRLATDMKSNQEETDLEFVNKIV